MCEFIEALVAKCPYDGDEGFRVGNQNEYAYVETPIGRVEILASARNSEHHHTVLWPWGGRGLLTKPDTWAMWVDRYYPLLVRARSGSELYERIIDTSRFIDGLAGWFHPDKFGDGSSRPMEDRNKGRRRLDVEQ